MTASIALFANGLGNLVMYTPALAAFASGDPSGKIDICIGNDSGDRRGQAIRDLLRALPFIDSVHGSQIPAGKGYTRYLWSDHTGHGPALAWFRKMNPMRLEPWNQNETTEIDYYMGIVRRHFGYSGETPPQTVVPADFQLPATQKRRIALCNGSFDYLAEIKQWPRFAELAKTVRAYYGAEVEILKVGAWEELADVSDFDADYVDKLSITQTAAVLEQCDLLVCTDTGLMHVADALGVPMVVIWGGSTMLKNLPASGRAVVLSSGRRCAPCQDRHGYNTCKVHECLLDISVGLVMQEIRKAIP